MKNILLSFALLLAALHLWGQSDLPTYGYNYQAVIRNANGTPVPANTTVQLRFRILTATDQNLYEETHNTTTDVFGRVALVVGAGTPAGTAKFDTLSWAARKHFLDVAVKIGAAADWADLGKEEVVQPPLAKGSGDWLLKGKDIYRLDGNVGVGTGNPLTPLHIENSDPDLSLFFNNNPTGNLAEIRFGRNGTKESGIYWNRLTNNLVAEYDLQGLGLGKFIIEQGGQSRLTISNNGKIGVGTTNPQAKLDIEGDARVKGAFIVDVSNFSGFGGRDAIHINASADNNAGVIVVNKPKLAFWNSADSKPANLECGSLTILGNDRTERFNTTTNEALPAYTVAVFDEAKPGHIRLCTRPYDRKAAGVVSDLSGKGEYRPGIIHEQENTKNGSPVALDGTVEVLAVGPVSVGDFLTTSGTPGYAMRATNRRKSYGAVLGKAVTPLAKGEKGKVVMFVERH